MIRKRLLIHDATLKKISRDTWGNEVTDEIELSNVRIEPSSKIVINKNNAEIQLTSTMFFDVNNSKPNDVEFAEKDVITFNGIDYTIEMIEKLYTTKFHHYELGLM